MFDVYIIIFASEFKSQLDSNLLSNYKKIIFSDYKLCNNLFDAYLNNKFNNLKYNNSKFNLPVNLLPPTPTHLTFGCNFNQQCNLSSNVKYLKLSSDNNYLINNLPNGVEELILGEYFNSELNNLPNRVKKII